MSPYSCPKFGRCPRILIFQDFQVRTQISVISDTPYPSLSDIASDNAFTMLPFPFRSNSCAPKQLATIADYLEFHQNHRPLESRRNNLKFSRIKNGYFQQFILRPYGNWVSLLCYCRVILYEVLWTQCNYHGRYHVPPSSYIINILSIYHADNISVSPLTFWTSGPCRPFVFAIGTTYTFLLNWEWVLLVHF